MDDLAQQPFITKLKKWDSETLFRARDAVQEITAAPGWGVLMDLIGEGQESLKRLEGIALMKGWQQGKTISLEDQAHLAWLAGRQVGMESLAAAAQAVLTAAENKQSELEGPAREGAKA